MVCERIWKIESRIELEENFNGTFIYFNVHVGLHMCIVKKSKRRYIINISHYMEIEL